MVALAVSRGYADTPASQVYQQTVQPTQTYPEVAANGEGWFDVGGFCKVVDVGDLSSMTPPASGVPVFVPGPTDQWENYRTSAPTSAGYKGRLTLTTCCRPQSNIANLCTEAGATPVSVSRQYGKLGETDVVSATCVDEWGKQYTDSVSLTCQGDDGPNGQAQWAEVGGDSTSNCTANANITYGGCSQSCSEGGSIGHTYETVQDSCGVVTAQGYIGPECGMQNCCKPNWQTTCGGCSGPTKTCTTTDLNNCVGSVSSSSTQACTEITSFGSCPPNNCSTLPDGFHGCSCLGSVWTFSGPAWIGTCTDIALVEVDINDWEPWEVSCVLWE